MNIADATYTAWNVSKYGVIFDPYFPVFGLNTGKYGAQITPYWTLHAVLLLPDFLHKRPYPFTKHCVEKIELAKDIGEIGLSA